MRQPPKPQNLRNNRGKIGRKPMGPSINRVYESSGPEGKVRGTPQQIIEKYETLSRDAATAGDRVMAENYLQHAEHYTRILLAATGAYDDAPARRPESDEELILDEGAEGEAEEMMDEPAPEPPPPQPRHDPRADFRVDPRGEGRHEQRAPYPPRAEQPSSHGGEGGGGYGRRSERYNGGRAPYNAEGGGDPRRYDQRDQRRHGQDRRFENRERGEFGGRGPQPQAGEGRPQRDPRPYAAPPPPTPIERFEAQSAPFAAPPPPPAPPPVIETPPPAPFQVLEAMTRPEPTEAPKRRGRPPRLEARPAEDAAAAPAAAPETAAPAAPLPPPPAAEEPAPAPKKRGRPRKADAVAVAQE